MKKPILLILIGAVSVQLLMFGVGRALGERAGGNVFEMVFPSPSISE